MFIWNEKYFIQVLSLMPLISFILTLLFLLLVTEERYQPSFGLQQKLGYSKMEQLFVHTSRNFTENELHCDCVLTVRLSVEELPRIVTVFRSVT